VGREFVKLQVTGGGYKAQTKRDEASGLTKLSKIAANYEQKAGR
jgi:hypothetical protein